MSNRQPDKKYYEQARPEIARLIVGHPQAILDVGCASGYFKSNIGWSCDYQGGEPFAAAGVLDCTHLRFFTLKSARRLLKRAVLRSSGRVCFLTTDFTDYD